MLIKPTITCLLLAFSMRAEAISTTSCRPGDSGPAILAPQGHSNLSVDDPQTVLALSFIRLLAFIHTDKGWFAELRDALSAEIVIQKADESGIGG